MFSKEDENYIYELVSKNFKKQRKKLGISKEKVAKACGYTAQFIGNIESPKYHQTFSLASVYLFAKALDIDIRLLFESDDEEAS